MCGRYASSRKPEDLVEEFEVERVEVLAPLEADYNVAPTKDVYAVFDRVSRRDREGADGEVRATRRLKSVRWGLVPSWAKDRGIGSRMINARVETLADKPAYRKAFAKRRCLLPADGYFEWYPTQQAGQSGKPLKQPFFIRPRDGGVLAMAGLYEIWRDKSVLDESADDAFLWTATVVTTSAEDAVGHIHDRMPMLVEPERYADWLDSTVSGTDELAALLVPAAPGRLEAYPVSREVNDVRNNGPQLVLPVDVEENQDRLFDV
ncbi:MAG: SOS response-associated peptidase [Propionibacteriales bacterium]|nr:SOS response-associated peptidase [Propionibacteriales bacterium]